MIAKNAAAAAFSNAEVTRNVPNSHQSRLNRLLWLEAEQIWEFARRITFCLRDFVVIRQI